jgi:subtilisin family serine protease
MPVSVKEKAQADLVLNNLPGAAAYPAPAQWDDDDVGEVDYLYRKDTILTREQDADGVVDAISRILDAAEGSPQTPDEAERRRQIGRERVSGTRRVIRLRLPSTRVLVPEILDRLDRELGVGVATPDHILYLCPTICAAAEPIEVAPGTDPVPPPGLNTRGCRPCHGVPPPECDGDGVFISILDTGLIPDAAAGHPWLVGVQGTTDPVTEAGGTTIVPYDAGHGTFVAGVARCMAPKVSAYVERAFEFVGANFETNLVGPSLEDALSRNPDILEFTFCATSRGDVSLITFDDFFETRIRYMKGLVVLAPAGNDGKQRRTWPAAYREVISVGALSASWRDRAWFSNYGKWVDVYAPGEDLINAFPSGTYVCTEPPIGQHRVFDGMAKWSGTSFSTPVVAGLIAARMSTTGENARQAADSLLRLANRQAIPGIGAVLYPGQACCEADHCRH